MARMFAYIQWDTLEHHFSMYVSSLDSLDWRKRNCPNCSATWYLLSRKMIWTFIFLYKYYTIGDLCLPLDVANRISKWIKMVNKQNTGEETSLRKALLSGVLCWMKQNSYIGTWTLKNGWNSLCFFFPQQICKRLDASPWKNWKTICSCRKNQDNLHYHVYFEHVHMGRVICYQTAMQNLSMLKNSENLPCWNGHWAGHECFGLHEICWKTRPLEASMTLINRGGVGGGGGWWWGGGVGEETLLFL